MGAGEILRTSCNKYTAFMALVAHTEQQGISHIQDPCCSRSRWEGQFLQGFSAFISMLHICL